MMAQPWLACGEATELMGPFLLEIFHFGGVHSRLSQILVKIFQEQQKNSPHTQNPIDFLFYVLLMCSISESYGERVIQGCRNGEVWVNQWPLLQQSVFGKIVCDIHRSPQPKFITIKSSHQEKKHDSWVSPPGLSNAPAPNFLLYVSSPLLTWEWVSSVTLSLPAFR